MRNIKRIVLAALLPLSLLGGCAQYDNQRGVEVRWQPTALNSFVSGQTTRQEVMTTLGPPSQVIALKSETVLYYLFEHAKGEGLLLVAYNRFETQTRYDRAIFFFDENDLLTDHAAHINN